MKLCYNIHCLLMQCMWPAQEYREGLHLRPDVLSVFDKCDIFCIQETWFAVQDLHVVNSLHSKFHGFGVSTTDYEDGLVSGNPPGGVAIFWRKHLDQYIKPIDLKCDWCTTIEFNTDSNTVVIINFYLPYNAANEDNEKLGYIHAVIDEINTSCYVVFGDRRYQSEIVTRTAVETSTPHVSQ